MWGVCIVFTDFNVPIFRYLAKRIYFCIQTLILYETMAKIMKIKNVDDYGRYVGHTGSHPLVCVIDYAEVSPVRHCLNNYGVYGIFFHDEAEIDLAYGCGKYDYKKGTVICVAPGQIGGKEDNGEQVMLTGWALLFHPDLLHGTIWKRV